MRLTYEQQTKNTPHALFEDALNNKTHGIRFYRNDLRHSEYLSYFELSNLAREYARGLSLEGVGPQERVLICAENTPEFVIAWLALLQLGAVPVPMPPSSTLAGDNSFVHRLTSVIEHHRNFICRGSDYEKWRNLPEAKNVRYIDIAQFSIESPHPLSPAPILYPELEESAEAFIQYTSGSTSSPKGIVITYRNIVENTAALADAIGVSDGDAFISWLPLYHDYGLVCNFMLCLLQKCDYILTAPMAFIKRPLRFLELVGQHQATAVCMPNFALEHILAGVAKANADLGNLDLSSLKWWSIGAEPIVEDNLGLIETTFSRYGLKKGVMAPSYGLAEATVGVSVVRPGQRYESYKVGTSELVLNGPVIKGFDLKIEDPDENGFGILKMAGASVAQHAYIDGKKTKISDPEGYVDTKDIAKLTGSQLAVAGRIDEMLCLRGENVFPYDIEAIVRRIPNIDVRRVACFFLGGAREHKVVLVYETKNISKEENQGWHNLIREQVIARSSIRVDEIYAVPTKTIPVTTSGKIQRVKAARLYEETAFNNVSLVQSQGVAQ